MRRVAAALVGLPLLLLAACGGSGSGDGAAKITLVLFGDPVETAGYRALVEEFEAANDDVDVTLSPVAKQDELLAKLTTSFAGGEPPDVFLINFRRYGQFAEQGVLAPVQPLLDASDTLDEDVFFDAPLEAFRYDGRSLTCLPQNASSLAVYYNADLFRAAGVPVPVAGWTWDDLLSAARRLTRDGVYGLGTDVQLIRLAPFVWSAGGEVVDPADPAHLAVAEGSGRAGLDFFLDLALRHQVVPPEREARSEEAEARFLRGGLGMYLDSRKAVPSLRAIDGFDWDVAPLPVGPSGKAVTILHSDAYCLAKDGDTGTAWRFVEFAMGERGQRLLAESGRTVPSRRDVAESAAFLSPERAPRSSQVFLDALDAARATPHSPQWSRVEKEGDSLLEAVFYGRVPRERGVAELVRVADAALASRS